MNPGAASAASVKTAQGPAESTQQPEQDGKEKMHNQSQRRQYNAGNSQTFAAVAHGILVDLREADAGENKAENGKERSETTNPPDGHGKDAHDHAGQGQAVGLLAIGTWRQGGSDNLRGWRIEAGSREKFQKGAERSPFSCAFGLRQSIGIDAPFGHPLTHLLGGYGAVLLLVRADYFIHGSLILERTMVLRDCGRQRKRAPRRSARKFAAY